MIGTQRLHRRWLTLAAAAVLLVQTACGSDDEKVPQLAPATGTALLGCTDLTTKGAWPNTVLTSAEVVAAGTLTVAGQPVREHCLVKGYLNQRVSPVDGETYAIQFEMRLPTQWDGRFFYQANGGTEGSVKTATGAIGGGGPLDNPLNMGTAVISTDGGHTSAQVKFGRDPQARQDYGYNTEAVVTPFAKNLVKVAYGKGPDRSYFGGCSNGGRHTMVAATRLAGEYDGFLVGNPGFHLPQAAVANMWGAQQLATVATASTAAGYPDLTTSFTQAERQTISNAVLAKCDALDGATDGLVQDTSACQRAFDLFTDVPTCAGERDGTCLTAKQKSVLATLFAGARNSAGKALYVSWPWDAGLWPNGWVSWKATMSITRDVEAVGYVFQTPPEEAIPDTTAFALNFNADLDAPKIFATDATYTEASMTFMPPVNETDLSAIKGRGAKMIVYHGTSDPIFSAQDTIDWYQGLMGANGGDASNFARLFLIPGMNHCSGGPATDQFDGYTALVNWVEKGQAPQSLVATARGAGNAGGVNGDVPAAWSASRTRPLCPFPKVAHYKGSGDPEKADSFECR